MTTLKWRPTKLRQVTATLTNNEFEMLLQIKAETGSTTTDILRRAVRELYTSGVTQRWKK